MEKQKFYILQYKMAGNKKSIQKLVKLYKNIMNFLQFIDIKLILFYGSLLGYGRGDEFIEGDDDIDVIVSRNDFNKMKEYIKNNIHKYPNIRVGINEKDILQLFYKKIGPFDIYAYNDNNTDILLAWDGNLLFDKNMIFPLQKIKFNEYKIYTPNNIIEILEQIYGDSWYIPTNKNDYNWNDINTVRKLDK